MSSSKKICRFAKSSTTEDISFGFDRQTDEHSLALFLTTFNDPKLLEILIPRLSDAEITTTVDFLSGLLKANLTGDEYHRLFLSK